MQSARSGYSYEVAIETQADIPMYVFWGAQICTDCQLDDLFAYLNEMALLKNQWQQKSAAQGDYLRIMKEKYWPIFAVKKEEVKAARSFHPKQTIRFYSLQQQPRRPFRHP